MVIWLNNYRVEIAYIFLIDSLNVVKVNYIVVGLIIDLS